MLHFSGTARVLDMLDMYSICIMSPNRYPIEVVLLSCPIEKLYQKKNANLVI